MRNIKTEATIATSDLYDMIPKSSNYRKAMVDDVLMPDVGSGSSFASSFGLPTASDTFRSNFNNVDTSRSDFNNVNTPRSDAPPPSLASDQRPDRQRSHDSGLHIVGRRVQVLVDAINDIRGMGVDYLVELPQLVLVGDQSAGKSSLMGALAEIHLPQDSKCCTRCPTHIKTGTATTWSCKISLHLSYTYEPRPNGRPIEARDVNSKNLFPPWKETELQVRDFMLITDKSQLEEALKWAQIAILNPSKTHKIYIPDRNNNVFVRNEDTEAKFSPNVVFVEMSGPALAPLSFFDLPGIFQNPGQREDSYLVSVVENLAKKYIKHQQALVIWALPMSADPATSRTGKVILDLKAESRTIGVLTKADCLQLGHSDLQFRELLQGRAHVVGHGYFVTKQPAQLSRKIEYDTEYHKKARADEEKFFGTQSPWAESWYEFQDRFGTRNLQHALSQKFAAQIVNCIPKIEETVSNRRQQIDAELARLPQLPTDNISQAVLQELARFTQQIQALMDGTNPSLHSAWSTLNGQLYEALVNNLYPTFIVRDPSDLAVAASQMDIDGPEVIDLDSESPKTDKGIFETPPRAPTFRPKRENQEQSASPQAPKRYANGAEKVRAEALTANPFTTNIIESYRIKVTIGDIRQTLVKYSKPGAPGHVDFRAKDELCMNSVKVWEHPVEKYLDMVVEMVRDHSLGILDQVLCKWRQTQLYKQGFELLKVFFDRFENDMRSAGAQILSLELYKFFTINRKAFDRYQAAEFNKISEARQKHRVNVLADQQMQGLNIRDERARRNTRNAKVKAIIKDDVLGEDPFKTEIEVAALVRGYYLTAADRFCDQICLTIHGRLFTQVQKDIFHYLEKELGLHQGNTEERYRELMEEDVSVARRRRNLQNEKEKLKKFTTRLLQLAADDKRASTVERAPVPEVEMSM